MIDQRPGILSHSLSVWLTKDQVFLVIPCCLYVLPKIRCSLLSFFVVCVLVSLRNGWGFCVFLSCVSVNRVPQSLTGLQDKPFLETPSLLFWTGEDLLCWDNLSLAIDNFPIVSLSLVSSEGHSKFFTLHLTAQVSTVLGIHGRSQQVLRLSPDGMCHWCHVKVTASAAPFT